MFEITIVGHLGHNNDWFDRTCPQCGGLYCSHRESICSKCGTTLTHIKTKKGRAMGISEGTIYPIQRKEHAEIDAENIAKKKTGLKPVYRFALFSFADDAGVLAPPGVHQYLTSGRQILIRIHHQPVPSYFQSKDTSHNVELKLLIFPHMGDTIELLGGKRAADNMDVGPSPGASPDQVPSAQGATAGQQMTIDTATLFRLLPQLQQAITNAATSTSSAPTAEAPMVDPSQPVDLLANAASIEPIEPDDDIPF